MTTTPHPSSAVVSVPVSSAVPQSSMGCAPSSSSRQTTTRVHVDAACAAFVADDVGADVHDGLDYDGGADAVATAADAGVQRCSAMVAAFGTDFSHRPDRKNPRWSHPSPTSSPYWCADHHHHPAADR